MNQLISFIRSNNNELIVKALDFFKNQGYEEQSPLDNNTLQKVFNGIFNSIEKDAQKRKPYRELSYHLNNFCTKTFGKKYPFKLNIQMQQEILNTSRTVLTQMYAENIDHNYQGFQDTLNLVSKIFNSTAGKLCQQWDLSFQKLHQEDLNLIDKLKIVKNDLQTQLNIIYQIIKNSPIAIVGCDDQLNIKIWNPMASRLTGFQQSEVLKKSIKTIIPSTMHNKLILKLESEQRIVHKMRLNILLKNGYPFPAFVSISKIDNPYSNLQYIISFIDLRGEEKTQSQLQQINQLTALSRLSGAIMHDIRNPVNSIGLNVELLEQYLQQSGPYKDEVRGILDSLLRQRNLITQNLNQYLGYSRFAEFNPESLKLSSYLSNLILELQVEAASKNIKIKYKPPRNDYLISGDWLLLRRVFANLIQNAIEAIVREGKISIRIHKRNKRIHVKICDDGPGIEVNQVRNIFEPYFTTKQTGVGLGLYIVREIVHAHKGRITCTSQKDKGTHFTLSFPYIEPL